MGKLTKSIRQNIQRVLAKAATETRLVCENYKIFNNPDYPSDWFGSFFAIGYNPSTGNPTTHTYWSCFDATGQQTDYEPHFESFTESNKFYENMQLIAAYPSVSAFE